MDQKVRVEGSISWKSLNVVEWTVPDFFTVTEKFFFCRMESPPFSYMGGTWCIDYWPGWTTMYTRLKRVKSSSNHKFTFRIGIKHENGQAISENITANFEEDGAAYGTYLCTNRDILLREIAMFAPQGAITFFCTLPSASNNCEESKTKQSEGGCVLCENPLEDATKPDCEEIVQSSEFTSTSGLNNLGLNLLEIYLKEEHSDLLLTVKDQEFKAHKLILGARSRVFSAMFAHDTQENISNTIEITDCEPEAFRHFLRFLYSGQVKNVPGKQVFDLYYIADKYNIDELKKECAKFLSDHITIDTFCDVMSLALMHKETTLLEKATNYFIKHVNEINVTVKWLSFIKEYPIECNELYIKTLNYKKS